MKASRVSESVNVVNQIGSVIFPDNKWIKIWDTIIIVLLLLIAFIIPYQIGVSGGIYLITDLWWLIVNVIINTAFFVDTFLYFWRAYRDKEGRLVFNLRRIRRRYLKTYFIPNLLSNFPATLIFYCVVTYRIRYQLGNDEVDSYTILLIKLMDFFKLFRFVRVKAIMETSTVITRAKQNVNSQLLQLCRYTCLLVLVSHLFACVFSFVAFIEAGQFTQEALLATPNWIGNWYETSYIEGGLNPLGWGQDTDRYVLSLFLAIQSITSIGYGNIVPLTPSEWWVWCIMMLAAGIMWAYTIGGLVGVVAVMNARSEIYRERIDQANAMIKLFETSNTRDANCPDIQVIEDARDLERRIKSYIHSQLMISNNNAFASNIMQSFPVVETLSPDLQRLSAFMILKDDLETVPYLSSRFLSIAARSEVAMECLFLEFPAGENIDIEKGVGDLGRGIYVIHKGMGALRGYRSDVNDFGSSELLLPGMTCGTRKVLVEDGHPAAKGYLELLSFAKVVFIPRRAVLAALAKNPTTWKDCARWNYLSAVLLSAKKLEKEKAVP